MSPTGQKAKPGSMKLGSTPDPSRFARAIEEWTALV
jgi:hypothetical protein